MRVTIKQLYSHVCINQDNQTSRSKSVYYHVPCKQGFSARFKRLAVFYNIHEGRNHFCPKCGVRHSKWDATANVWKNANVPISDVELKVVERKNRVDLIVTYKYVRCKVDRGYGNENEINLSESIGKTEIQFHIKDRRVIVKETLEMQKEISPFCFDITRYFGALNWLNYASKCIVYKQELDGLIKHLRLLIDHKMNKLYPYRTWKTPYKPCRYRGGSFFAEKQLLELVKTIVLHNNNDVDINKLFNDKFSSYVTSSELYSELDHFNSKVLPYIQKNMPVSVAIAKAYGNNTSKSMIKILRNNPSAYGLLHYVERVTKNKSVQNKIVEILSTYRAASLGHYAIENVANNIWWEITNVLAFIKNKMGVARLVKVLERYNANDMVDMATMFHELSLQSRQELLERPLQIKDLHDEIMRYHALERTVYEPLPFDADKCDSIGGVTFYPPKDTVELKILGSALKNCVSSYKERIKKKETEIVIGALKNHPIVCMEIKDNQIVQAKLKSNLAVHMDVAFNKAILDYADAHKLGIGTRDIDCTTIAV